MSQLQQQVPTRKYYCNFDIQFNQWAHASANPETSTSSEIADTDNFEKYEITVGQNLFSMFLRRPMLQIEALSSPSKTDDSQARANCYSWRVSSFL